MNRNLLMFNSNNDKQGILASDAHRKEKKRIQRIAMVMGLGVPILFAVVLYLLRPEPIEWLFSDTSRLATTNGMITESNIELSGSPALNAVAWHYVIQYEYYIEGKRYISNRVSYGTTGSSDKSYAEEYIKRYPIGKPVLVYYDPKRPEKSALEPWVKDFQPLYLVAGALLFGCFIIFMSFYLK